MFVREREVEGEGGHEWPLSALYHSDMGLLWGDKSGTDRNWHFGQIGH